MHRTCLIVIVGLMLTAGARVASAQVGQAWTDRGYANLNVGFETASGTLNDATTFTLYGEPASRSLVLATDSGALFDFSAGSRVWRNVSVGIGYHRGGTNGEATVQASVPHPLFFNANRAAAAAASGLDRTEQAVHLLFGYMLPVTDRISVHLTLGPSFFRLKQEVVSDVTITEQGFPFTNVNLDPVVTERSDSAVGGNIGVDIGYQLYDTDAYRLGAGMFIRYAGASAKVGLFENEVDSDVGGLQIGFGGRLKF